jgi:hypothetical protein
MGFPYMHGFENVVKQDDLLLHSLANFEIVFRKIFETVAPRTLCEIGVESGKFSTFLLDYCEKNGIIYTGIDTNKKSFIIHENYPSANTYATTSLKFLTKSKICNDIYIIDGDHNYHTVYNELNLIYALYIKTQSKFPCLFLHDVGWPTAYRDSYYAPETLPPRAVHHPYSFYDGVTMRSPFLLPRGGFRGEGQYAFSAQFGGQQNGVRTAITDFLEQKKDIDISSIYIPSIFGLAILYSPAAYSADTVSAIEHCLTPWRELSEFLGLLEYNRLNLYLKVLELQDEIKN